MVRANNDMTGGTGDEDCGYGVAHARDQFLQRFREHQKEQHTSKRNLAARLEAKKMDARRKAMRIRLQRLENIIDRSGSKLGDHLDKVSCPLEKEGEARGRFDSRNRPHSCLQLQSCAR